MNGAVSGERLKWGNLGMSRVIMIFLMLVATLDAGALAVAQPRTDAAPGAARKAAPGETAAAQTAANLAQLPNGASSLNETYGNWTIECRVIDGRKQCLLMHAQGNSQTRQRLFEIELQTPQNGKTEATILMPFGLKLDSGAILTLDDKDFTSGRFSTCTPLGCLLPVSFPVASIDAMKKAKTLTVASLNLGNSEVVSFKVSLDGFAPAIARLAELGK
jgi:invasion protein IalB